MHCAGSPFSPDSALCNQQLAGQRHLCALHPLLAESKESSHSLFCCLIRAMLLHCVHCLGTACIFGKTQHTRNLTTTHHLCTARQRSNPTNRYEILLSSSATRFSTLAQTLDRYSVVHA